MSTALMGWCPCFSLLEIRLCWSHCCYVWCTMEPMWRSSTDIHTCNHQPQKSWASPRRASIWHPSTNTTTTIEPHRPPAHDNEDVRRFQTLRSSQWRPTMVPLPPSLPFLPAHLTEPPRKIPWRMSPPQKLRHRRRMRRVDNVVAVLDTALRRQAASSVPAQPTTTSTTAPSEAILSRTNKSPSTSNQHSTSASQPQTAHPAASAVASSSRTQQSSETRQQSTIKLISRWKSEMPAEGEMLPRDKYTMFDRKAKGYRKGVHKLPKWTRVSQRLNPPGF